MQYAHKTVFSLNKTTLKTCAVAGAIAITGSIVALIYYMCRFNLGDAQELIRDANIYKTGTEEHYAQEFSILSSGSEEEHIKSIKAIITKARTSTPYFLYAQKVSNSLKECNKLIKKIHKGTPKLQAHYQKIQTHAHQYDPLKLADEIDQTEKALETLKKLEVVLSLLADQLTDLYVLCTRTEGYKSEVQMMQLAAINASLNSIRIQNALNSSTPRYYYTPTYYRYY